ncbi:Lipoprotein [Bacillus thuringiensis serovar kurstaki str. HD-1]|nr:Lipoprotein [Bacillus thuringiensis serovar kurstaki str. HD-1]
MEQGWNHENTFVPFLGKSVFFYYFEQRMKKMIAICLLTTMSFSTLVGCDVKGSNAVQESKIKKATYKDFTYDVNPETFTLTVEHELCINR